MEAGDAEYSGSGSWYRCELRDGTVVYIGGCGECATPWLETEEPAISGEWTRVDLSAPDPLAAPRDV